MELPLYSFIKLIKERGNVSKRQSSKQHKATISRSTTQQKKKQSQNTMGFSWPLKFISMITNPMQLHFIYSLEQNCMLKQNLVFILKFQSVQHQESTVSSTTVYEMRKKSRRKQGRSDSLSIAGTSNFDITGNFFSKNDYFSDVNPRSMRRLLNIVAVTGKSISVSFRINKITI